MGCFKASRIRESAFRNQQVSEFWLLPSSNHQLLTREQTRAKGTKTQQQEEAESLSL